MKPFRSGQVNVGRCTYRAMCVDNVDEDGGIR